VSLLGSTFVPRRGSAYAVRLDNLLWFAAPLLALLIIVGIYFALPDKITAPGKDATVQLIGLLAALLVYLLPSIWAYFIARRARLAYGREWQVLDRARTTTLNDRSRLEGLEDISTAEQEQLLDARRYIGRHAAGEGQEERVAQRMIQQALRNARELRRDSDLSTQLYTRDLTPLRLALRVPQTVALRLGILLRFIGLLQGLQPVAQSAGAMSPDLVKDMVEGLTGAFACSIAGIAAAILIQLLIVVVDRDYLIVARLLESTWMDLGHTLANLRLKRGDLPATLDRMLGELGTNRQEMRETSREIREQTRLAIDSMASNDERLQKFIQESKHTQTALDEIASAQRQRAAEASAALRQIDEYESRWKALFTERLDEAIATQASRHELALRELTNALAASEKRLASEIHAAIRSEADQLGRSVDRFQQALASHSGAMTAAAEKLAALVGRPAANEPVTTPERKPSLVVSIGGAVLLTLVVILSMLKFLSQ
jgi:hypothetical protein